MKKKKEEGVGGRVGGGEENIIFMVFCFFVFWVVYKFNRSLRRVFIGEMF